MEMEMQSVSVPGIGEPVPVHTAGSGDTVVYLHGIWDQPPNEFLQGLARTHKVVAPIHLGGRLLLRRATRHSAEFDAKRASDGVSPRTPLGGG